MSLQDLSDELSAQIESASASVLRVEGRRRAPSSGVVWSADGLVVASHHAVDAEEDVPVGLADGRTLPAAVVGRDPGCDLVLLRLADERLTPLPRAESSAVRLGQLVVGLSRPGRALRAQIGIVSAVVDGWRTASGRRLERYLESSVALHVGFSGGALLGKGGLALGVHTAGLVRGAGLAVPVESVGRSVEALLASGRVRRGYLGIGTQTIALASDARWPEQRSALIVLSVQPESPAARAGLLLGDVLLQAGGEPLGHPAALLPLLDEERIGGELSLRVLRAGQPASVTLVVGERTGS